MKAELERFNADVEELRALINTVSMQCRPRRYVQNRRTRVIHRIAVGFEECGVKARTRCGWRYANRDVHILADPPTKKKWACDSCLPSLRASLDE